MSAPLRFSVISSRVASLSSTADSDLDFTQYYHFPFHVIPPRDQCRSACRAILRDKRGITLRSRWSELLSRLYFGSFDEREGERELSEATRSAYPPLISAILIPARTSSRQTCPGIKSRTRDTSSREMSVASIRDQVDNYLHKLLFRIASRARKCHARGDIKLLHAFGHICEQLVYVL